MTGAKPDVLTIQPTANKWCANLLPMQRLAPVSGRTFGRLRNARWQVISVQRLRDGAPLGLQTMKHMTHQGESFFDVSSRVAIHCEFRDKRSKFSNVAVGIGDLFIYLQLIPSLPATSSAWSLGFIVLELGLLALAAGWLSGSQFVTEYFLRWTLGGDACEGS